ncbi:MAG TPA: hypothetical protein VNP72_00040 [Longimicrobium sp.]|nr:hypothetical protein [Longimicrobium sp.]
MRNLKIESLQVESFATTSAATTQRGTVAAHGFVDLPEDTLDLAGRTNRNCPPQTYNIEVCGDTMYFDCTLGCTIETNCICQPVP